jgi:hypothetical protein
MATAAEITETIEEIVILDHPPEPVAKTSISAVLAGLCLIVGLLILAVFLWASRGEKDGKPDAFGKYVRVRDVSERYKASWTPGKFWPSDKEHSYKNDGSPLFGAVWLFLMGWLFVSGWFLVIAGALSSIEIFRQDEHLRAAGCVAAALCLCASWPLFFRIGSHAPGHEPAPRDATTGEKRDPSAPLPREEPFNTTKGVFLWISWAVLQLAAILATVAAGSLNAWTLPGPQYGTLFFLGPGYGLFAGWLWFASALNCSVAISHASYPAGTVAKPDGDTSYTHRPSIWPIFIALVLLGVSVSTLDPAIPVPTLIALFFFTPKNMTHLIASFLCVVAVGLSASMVMSERG